MLIGSQLPLLWVCGRGSVMQVSGAGGVSRIESGHRNNYREI